MSSNTSEKSLPDVGVIIAAGGVGRRFGGARPKQFLKVGRRSILEQSVAMFESHPLVRRIVIVAPRRYVGTVARVYARRKSSNVCAIIPGGRLRQDSVRAGLGAFGDPPDIVLVHDAVRPLVERTIIADVVRAAQRFGAAVVGTPVKDTIKLEGRGGFAARTLPRRKVWAVQTPQGFRYELLVRAHESARKAGFVGTDEASLVERLGRPVRLVRGSESNIKITTRQDLELARFLALQRGRKRGRSA